MLGVHGDGEQLFYEPFPQLGQQLMIVKVVQEVGDNKVEESNHFHEMFPVLFLFDFLLAHHFSLDRHSDVHFFGLNFFYFVDLPLNQGLSPLLQLLLDVCSIFQHLSFEVY